MPMKKQSSLSVWLDAQMPNLPDPRQGLTVAEKHAFCSANKAIDKAVL